MGGSDFRMPPPVFSLLTLVHGCPLARTDVRISLVTAYSRCQARHGLGPREVPARLALAPLGLLLAGATIPSALAVC